ncbi:MAG: UDP-N-acetylmuramoyl-L-alanine--D-glutamate ligase [Desulfuromonadaceae bacterium]|nr:UDP-N-acetylmuramoyl-L-alanine--D-glutamate ligase [Desulfuromonadaceae bacterium]MDD2848416.1 UDP-N-acetylmuramoyl-L-alanine--D-glutamate ligase [Desulfuromonadaceae bacterium]MDD4129955.1 UDP-N-acetylmuramoyl-L-alanine--D-glutamate ligase [Desulfuromonadaceae bacterium]
MQLKDKKILVVGLAKTGVACARFLASKGAMVTVTDMRSETALETQLAELSSFGITHELERHDEATFLASDLIVVSPGVPMDLPQLVAAQRAGVEIISEIELAGRFIDAPVVAITGTNGKTTTTTLLGAIFKHNGYHTFIGGNIGNPLIEVAESKQIVDQVVAEISSFQLEWITSFRPTVAALLNLSEDHLDRYPDYQAYIDAKLRLFENQTEDDFAVVNRDDELVWHHSRNLKASVFPFSRKMELEEGIFYKDGVITYRHNGHEECFPTAAIRLQGVHNLENIMAAAASALLLGCRPDETFETILCFESLHHRMEFVREANGVRYYEDSKATNVGSVEKALESFTDITLIAGGKDKGGSYAPLAALVKERVHHLILIGEAAGRMELELGGLTDTRRAATLEEAVRISAEITATGGTVLMSPACSSFDMFRDYEERAQRFIAAVKAL